MRDDEGGIIVFYRNYLIRAAPFDLFTHFSFNVAIVGTSFRILIVQL